MFLYTGRLHGIFFFFFFLCARVQVKKVLWVVAEAFTWNLSLAVFISLLIWGDYCLGRNKKFTGTQISRQCKHTHKNIGWNAGRLRCDTFMYELSPSPEYRQFSTYIYILVETISITLSVAIRKDGTVVSETQIIIIRDDQHVQYCTNTHEN